MNQSNYTIGMAGHIDHGKTTLTKALTNIDTDRLKEEKERNISIELGYAPLFMESDVHVSIVDVPGHERFIRQMIAGVAGIDLVILVIAADEGVMPQTKEHLQILQFLGIEHSIIAITKIDQVDEEMLELVDEDIRETLKGTPFKHAPLVHVDSKSGNGVEFLKTKIMEVLKTVGNRDRYGSFRLPIDQVFSVQGQGTIVRGTIYEGTVKKGSPLMVLPEKLQTKARNIQVHHQDVEQSFAGQRTAINISGINRDQIKRGDVLVASDHFLVTDTIDVSIQIVDNLRFPLKQRAPVNVHVGTSEVMGKIVFFDRKEVKNNNKEEILCQLRLNEAIAVRRGDRLILRRPSPVETIGGGWIIDPKGEKYRFGQQTISMLQKKVEGSPEDLVIEALTIKKVLTLKELIQETSVDEVELKHIIGQKPFIALPSGKYTLQRHVITVSEQIKEQLQSYHNEYPMRLGMNKAEMTQSLSGLYTKHLVEYVVQQLLEQQAIKKSEKYVALESFQPLLPEKWKKRMEEIISHIKTDGINVSKWGDYLSETILPEDLASELRNYLIQTQQVYPLTDELLIHVQTLESAVTKLKEATQSSFELKDAKDALQLSRKYLIPFLELLDNLGYTQRQDTKREWL